MSLTHVSSSKPIEKYNRAQMQSSMHFNGMKYDDVYPQTVAKSRALYKSRANKTTYKSGETLSIRLNNSTALLDLKNSYLQFTLRHTEASTMTWSWGSGSVLNCISSVIVSSSSGKEIGREEKVGLRQARWLAYNNDNNYLSNNLSCMGYGDTGTLDLSGSNANEAKYKGQNDYHFAIPLWCLHGVFNMKNLGVPALFSGAEIKITFEDSANCMVASQDVKGKLYEISDAELLLDSISVNDGIMSEINKKLKSKEGLYMDFTTWDSNESTETTNSINVQASKAHTRVNYAMVFHTPSVTTADASADFKEGTLDATKISASDRLLSSLYSDSSSSQGVTSKSNNQFTQYKFNIGNVHYPQEAVIGSQTNVLQPYMQTQYVFDKMGDESVSHDVSYNDYGKGGLQTAVADFRRFKNNDSSLSGSITSNGRAIEFNAKESKAYARNIYFFVQYLTKLRVFATSVTVTD